MLGTKQLVRTKEDGENNNEKREKIQGRKKYMKNFIKNTNPKLKVAKSKQKTTIIYLE